MEGEGWKRGGGKMGGGGDGDGRVKMDVKRRVGGGKVKVRMRHSMTVVGDGTRVEEASEFGKSDIAVVGPSDDLRVSG